MTQPTQERVAAYTGQPGRRQDQSARVLFERIARWQRIALGCAAIGAGAILISALALSRPLPQVGPPPAGIAPLLPTTAPVPAVAGGSGGIGSAAPTAPAATGTSATPAAPQPNAQPYLTFLKGIDQQRAAMLASFDAALAQQNGAPQEFAAPNSNAGTAGTLLPQTAASLQTAFQAQTAPPQCAALSAAYAKLLQDECGMVAQAASSISSGDLRSAAALAAGDQRQNQTDALAADQALGAASAAAQTDKPFTIAADPSQNAGTGAPTPPGQPVIPLSGVPPAGGAPPSPVQPPGTTQPGRPGQDTPAASGQAAPQVGSAPLSPSSGSTPAP